MFDSKIFSQRFVHVLLRCELGFPRKWRSFLCYSHPVIAVIQGMFEADFA